MRTRRDGFPATALVTVLTLVWVLAIGLAAASSRPTTDSNRRDVAAPATAAPPASAPPQATGLVGDETCTTCHESEGKSLHASLHGKAQNVRTPAARTGESCETCHGPGRTHVDSGKKEDI